MAGFAGCGTPLSRAARPTRWLIGSTETAATLRAEPPSTNSSITRDIAACLRAEQKRGANTIVRFTDPPQRNLCLDPRAVSRVGEDAGVAIGGNRARRQHIDGDAVARTLSRQIPARLTFAAWFKKCRLLDTATHIGVRETRRIVGEYTLTLGDLQNGRQFEDVIAMCGYPIDIHDPTGAGGGAGAGPPHGQYL